MLAFLVSMVVSGCTLVGGDSGGSESCEACWSRLFGDQTIECAISDVYNPRTVDLVFEGGKPVSFDGVPCEEPTLRNGDEACGMYVECGGSSAIGLAIAYDDWDSPSGYYVFGNYDWSDPVNCPGLQTGQDVFVEADACVTP